MAAIFQCNRRRNVRKSLPIAMSIKHTLEWHRGAIRSFGFLQDNVHIVSGSYDGTMRKRDCETGQLIGEPWKGERYILAVALSPDGKTIACGRSDGSVQRCDTNGQMTEQVMICCPPGRCMTPMTQLVCPSNFWQGFVGRVSSAAASVKYMIV